VTGRRDTMARSPDIDPVAHDDQVPHQFHERHVPFNDLFDAATDAMSTFDPDQDDTVPVVKIGRVPLNKAREEFKRALRDLRPRPERPRKRRYPWLVAVAVVLVAITIIDLFSTAPASVPDLLVGSWQADAPAYANRGFELAADSVGFREGTPTATEWLPVTRVRSHRMDHDQIAYRITYVREGSEAVFRLTMDSADSTVRLDNNPAVVWRRQASP